MCKIATDFALHGTALLLGDFERRVEIRIDMGIRVSRGNQSGRRKVQKRLEQASRFYPLAEWMMASLYIDTQQNGFTSCLPFIPNQSLTNLRILD